MQVRRRLVGRGGGVGGGLLPLCLLLAACSGADNAPDGNAAGNSGVVAVPGGSGGTAAGGTSSGGHGGSAQGGAAVGGNAAGGAAGTTGGQGGNAGANPGGSGGMAGSAMGGSGGTGGSGALTLMQPIERAGLHTLEFGNTLFEVDGAVGARVVGFKLDGTNILTGPDNNAMFYGSTLWTGPESEWAVNPFMAVPGIDSDPYTMSIEQAAAIVADSAPLTIATKQLTAHKRFSVDLVKNAVVIDYSLKNEGTAPFDIGLWEVTRVKGEGLTFYPTGANAATLYGSLAVQPAAGHDWIDHATFAPGPAAASKAGADATGGWIAHVQADPAGDLLLIKQFPDVADGMAAPAQHEVEVFEQADASYIELELHSVYGSLAMGQATSWQVHWYLRRLPMGTDVSVGSQALIDAVTTALQ